MHVNMYIHIENENILLCCNNVMVIAIEIVDTVLFLKYIFIYNFDKHNIE